ncbi:putative thyroid transcription factor 1-associated protein 26-like [Apostichopus japonicus]|uniref:Putative thyroid transcription factor 1-associated protein 26-like n=1 Tax=Stichopus japonicus TaxID=307972 RepID=A0A2G8KKP0_STIJA|nr:putative thyroid transcription factor 1-associated protein 26-like [Apostichopus japonicus]
MKELGRQRKNLKDDLRRLKYKRVSGSLPEGQGYADKRKNAAVSRYRNLRRKVSKSKQIDKTAQSGLGHNEVEKKEYSFGNNRVSIEQRQQVISEETDLHHGKKEVPKPSPAPEKKTTPAERRKEAHRYSNAQKLYQEKELKKHQKKMAMQEERESRERALGNYKKKKLERNKRFNQRTKRGQPIMKHQIDFLLEKIKAQGD